MPDPSRHSFEIIPMLVVAALLSLPGVHHTLSVQDSGAALHWLIIAVGLHCAAVWLMRELLLAITGGSISVTGRWLMVALLSVGIPLVSESGFSLVLSSVSMVCYLGAFVVLVNSSRPRTVLYAVLFGLACAASPTSVIGPLGCMLAADPSVWRRHILTGLLTLIVALSIYGIFRGSITYWPIARLGTPFYHRDIMFIMPLLMFAFSGAMRASFEQTSHIYKVCISTSNLGMATTVLALLSQPVDVRIVAVAMLPICIVTMTSPVPRASRLPARVARSIITFQIGVAAVWLLLLIQPLKTWIGAMWYLVYAASR